MTSLVLHEKIESKIFLIRGKRVMMDVDLAELYGVPTKVLLQAVKRNASRFPRDFMYQLTAQEVADLRSQFVTSNRGGRRYLPYAFTEQGVAMLSSVLNSDRAIDVNIQIMRTFTRLREMLLTHGELKTKIEEMEKKYDQQFQVVFEAIRELIEERIEDKPRRKIGFHEN